MCRKNYLHQMTLMKIRIWSYMMMNLMQEFCLQYNTIYRDPWLLSNVHMFRRWLRYEWFTPHPTQISLKVNECIHNYMCFIYFIFYSYLETLYMYVIRNITVPSNTPSWATATKWRAQGTIRQAAQLWTPQSLQWR